MTDRQLIAVWLRHSLDRRYALASEAWDLLDEESRELAKQIWIHDTDEAAEAFVAANVYRTAGGSRS